MKGYFYKGIISTLLLRSELQSIDIYINEKCSNKIRKSNKQLFGKEMESDWIFVSLPHNENNINIKLEFSSEYLDYNGRINSIILGDKSNEIIYIVSSKVHKILAAIVLFSIGIILISIYFGSKKHDAMNYKKVLYFALCILLDIAFSDISNSRVIQRRS